MNHPRGTELSPDEVAREAKRYAVENYVGAGQGLPEQAEQSNGYERFSDRLNHAPARKKRRGPVVALVAVLAVLLVGAGAAFAYMGVISGNLHQGVDDDLRDALVQTDMANEPFYVLLMGTDKSQQREETGELDGVYRSDSIILARIDPVDKKAALITIPRDTLVDLGKYGKQKINAAHAFGDAALAVEAVSDLTGVKISHYAEIDFDGFRAIVDALGGVEVDVPLDIDDPDAGGSLKAGKQTLSGEQALILCRSRNAYNDISTQPDLMRAANQRTVLSAIAHKLLDADIATIANTISAVSGYVTTDLEINDIIGIAQVMRGLDPAKDIYTASMPGESKYIELNPDIDEGWYYVVDEDEWDSMVKRMNRGLPPSETAQYEETTGTVLATAGEGAADGSEKTASVTVKNATDHDGAAAQTGKLLNDAGFVNVSVGDVDDQFDYPNTLVVYDNPAQAREADQIVAAMGQGRAMINDGDWILNEDFLVVIGDDWKTDVDSATQDGNADEANSGDSADGDEPSKSSIFPFL